MWSVSCKIFTHNRTSIRNNGSEFGNDIFYIYDFIKHATSWSSDLHAFQALVISHRATPLWTKYTVCNFGMDNLNLHNCLILTRNTLISLPTPLSSSIFLPSSPVTTTACMLLLQLFLAPQAMSTGRKRWSCLGGQGNRGGQLHVDVHIL